MLTSKKEPLKLRSTNNIVIAPANTGKEIINKKIVTKTDQINKFIFSKITAELRIIKIVLKKLIAPKIDLRPARCNLKIEKSTLQPGCPILLKGGYKVQEVPLPPSTKVLIIIKNNDLGKNQ